MSSQIRAIHIIYGMNGGGIDYVANKYTNSSLFSESILLVVRPYSKQCKRGTDYDKSVIYFSPLKLRKFRINLISRISKFNPSHVFLHGFNAFILYYACLICPTKNIKIIHTYHGEYHPSTFLQYVKSLIFNEIVPFLLKISEINIIAVCNYSKQKLIRKGVPPKNIHVIHNAYPILSETKKILKSADPANQCLKIIATARLDYVKGLDTLIKAISIVKNSVDVNLDIYGAGPHKKNLCGLIDKLGLKNIVVIHDYRIDLSDAYSQADLYVNSSRHEYLSISILEALSYSLPVIATNVGGNPEIIENNHNGLLIPSENPEAMARAITQLSFNYFLRNKLIKNGLVSLNNGFSLSNFETNLKHFIHTIDSP